jgi:hypothetical protein
VKFLDVVAAIATESRTKKIFNMLADDTAAPAAARTLANAASQEGKLISDYLIERFNRDCARPVTVSDKIKSTAAAQEGRQAEREKFVPSEPPPTYKEPREAGDGSGVQRPNQVP